MLARRGIDNSYPNMEEWGSGSRPRRFQSRPPYAGTLKKQVGCRENGG